jgi:hypothetical protein
VNNFKFIPSSKADDDSDSGGSTTTSKSTNKNNKDPKEAPPVQNTINNFYINNNYYGDKNSPFPNQEDEATNKLIKSIKRQNNLEKRAEGEKFLDEIEDKVNQGETNPKQSKVINVVIIITAIFLFLLSIFLRSSSNSSRISPEQPREM